MAARTSSHDLPVSPALAASMRRGWEDAAPDGWPPAEVPPLVADRRALLSRRFPGGRLVIPAGSAPRRRNGPPLRFRPSSDYVYLTGDQTEYGVLVLEPDGARHLATLYVHAGGDRNDESFYRDRRHGELWVGRRPGLAAYAAALGLDCRSLDELAGALADPSVPTRVLRGRDSAVDALVPSVGEDHDAELERAIAELRLVKDDWEVAQIEAAVAAGIRGFEALARAIPDAVGGGGERHLEGVFALRARVAGNDVGFPPIVACGPHASILHWTRNDGPLRPGQLLLVDAGVESRSLYTSDLTRTLPVDGKFTATQRRVYELVHAALRAGVAAIAPGRPFRDFRLAVARVLAAGLSDWGILPVSGEESVRDDCGLHQRYTLCAPGHMLGLDLHDCAHADGYVDGTLQPGHVLTVEPGLYFQPNDVTLPRELRGMGVRIEDDVLVTDVGCRVLSERLPRAADDVEAWMASVRR